MHCLYNLIYYYNCIENVDYDSGPYTFTIPAGMTNITFNVRAIRDDDILEENENFYFTIDSSSLPNDITAGSPFQATVVIMDDDCKLFTDIMISMKYYIYPIQAIILVHEFVSRMLSLNTTWRYNHESSHHYSYIPAYSFIVWNNI